MLPTKTKIEMFLKIKLKQDNIDNTEATRIQKLLENMNENDITIISEYKNFTEQVINMTRMQQNAKSRMDFLKNLESGHGHSHDGSGHGHSH